MDRKEKLKMLISVAKDDVKDAQMVLEYAECAKRNGDKEMCDYFASYAKKRIATDLDEAHKKIVTEMNEMKKAKFADEVEHKDEASSMCWNIIHEEYIEWVDKIKRRLEALRA